jgi:hypothetical protein
MLPAIGEGQVGSQIDVEKGDQDGDGSHHPTLLKRRLRMAVVRIEVEDTGVGLRPADMEE